jgi:MFS transporter, DHA2 family, multidrug resistance protein
MSPLVGRNLGRVDPRFFATCAFIVFAAASFWRSHYTPDADFWTLALPQLLQGAGIAMFFAPLISITLGGLGPEKLAFGSGLVNFFRITAGSFGASLVTTFWQRREALHHSQLIEGITPYTPQANQALDLLGRSGLDDGQRLVQLNHMITQQSSLLAVNDIFWISGWLFALLLVSVWLARKPFGSGAAI